MPQLDLATYFGQIFWFLFFFSALYSCVFSFVLPSFALSMKIRQKRLGRMGQFSSLFRLENTNILVTYDNLVVTSAFTSCLLLNKNKNKALSWSTLYSASFTQSLLGSSYLRSLQAVFSKKAVIHSFIS